MNDMHSLLPVLLERLGRGEPLALATLVERKGSGPRGQGARLLADASGLVRGTVGGGAAEAAVLQTCAEVLRDGGSRLLDLTLSNASAAKEGMVCGGEVRLFVEALAPDAATRDFFTAAAAASERGGVLLTRIASGRDAPAERLLYAEGRIIGASPESGETAALPAALQAHVPLPESGMLSLAGKDYFAEPLIPPSRMIIAGGGHIAVPTAELAALAGFSVHVLDDRPEFSRPERFPRATSTRAVPEFVDCLAPFSPDAGTCVVIITRGHFYDETVLAQALRTEAGYIGMIGSRRKREIVYEALRGYGFTAAELKRVHCPIGLAIGAETPEEIAVSIVAECIAHKRGRLS